MNENNQHIEIDELISLYLDSQATERQQTELKRLILRDPSIGDRLKAMRHQQKLLNALPVETAPVSLADDVRAAMERKLILAETAEQSPTVLATGYLFVRRLMTIAAMFLLPVGLLGLVVFLIMKPATEGPPGYVVNRNTSDDTTATTVPPEETQIAAELPFKGTLVLRTDDFTTVSGAVHDTIEKRNLLANAFPSRTADTVRFEITASAKQVADLMDSLAAIRPQCRDAILHVQGDSDTDMIEIPDIKNEQFRILVYEDNPAMFNRLASRYASANRKTDPLYENTPDGYPEPSIPTLAGKYDMGERTVHLAIRVERAAAE